MSKVLKLKNSDLNVIGKVLSYPMKFQQGRVKNRFVKLLAEKAEVMETNRKEILTTLCDKDDKGAPAVENGQYKFSAENRKKFDEEYAKLVNEDVLIDVLPSLEADIPSIKLMINNSQVELETYEVAIIEDVLTAFDEVSPKAKPKK